MFSRRGWTSISGPTTVMCWFRTWLCGSKRWEWWRGRSRATADPVGRLLGRLGNARPPAAHVVAVLDDAHEITDRRVWRDLERLSSDSPPWLHWVIITRVDPPLSVQRLRLQGRLAQIRSADLAFDVDETMALMQWFGLEIPPDATRRLVTWSEGWAAALCLAARTMLSEDPHSRPWERLQASESFVMDFLVQEVFERLSAADREFLLRTSVADILTPELAAHLTGNPTAGAQLHRLERAGTFLLEVDPSGNRYRYHGLMAALLRARLNEEKPAEGPRLMRLAAEWYSTHGYLDEAEHHAARAGDVDLLANLRAMRYVDHLVATGGLPTGSGAPVSSSTVPAVKVLAAIDALRRHDGRVAHAVLGDVELRTEVAASTTPVRAVYELARVELARWEPTTTGDGQSRQEPLLVELSKVVRSASAMASYTKLRQGEALLAAGLIEQARHTFEEVGRTEGSLSWAQWEAEAILAVMEAVSGECARAMSMNRQLAIGHSKTDAAMWLNVATAVSHGLRGETAGLRSRTEVITAGHDRPRSWLFEQCTRLLVGVTMWQPPRAPLIEPPTGGLPTQVALALGIVETIDRHGRARPVGGPLEHTIALARRAIDEGSLRRLDNELAPWRVEDPTGASPRSVVELYTLMALADLHKEDEVAALASVQRAIALAAPSGLWGPLVEHGADLEHFLERHSWELGAASSAAVEMFDNLRTTVAAPVVGLTDRERAVLHYLPTLMSNHEIAAEMLISVNTVKTHLKAIYRKLGVERRRDALLRARQIELI